MREAPILVAVLLALTALAGCFGDATDTATTEPLPDAPATVTHVLDNATEPGELLAPTFRLVGSLYDGGPRAYGAGEPNVWAALDGTLYVAFAGCDTDEGGEIFVGESRCAHGVVYRSTDGGASWERLNGASDGRLSPDAAAANGDNDVTTDAAGNVYVSNLGGGIHVQGLRAGADAWDDLGNVVPEEHWADRQWMAAAAPGHLIMTWMGGAQPDHRQVAVNTTFDGGANWTGVHYMGENIGWLGSVQFAPDGQRAFIPYTQPVREIDPNLLVAGAQEFHLFVARTLDGGLTWESIDTGLAVTTSTTGGHWSGVLMAPSLDITGDGTIVYGWAEEVLDPSGRSTTGSVVKVASSTDGGDTWGAPVTVSTRAQAIMAWVTAGAGDRVAVTYMSSDVPGDSDYVGAWDVMAAVVDGLGVDGTPQVVETLVEANVHQGGACTRGGLCLLTGSDRALLDFFESDVTPEGHLIIAYSADPATGGKAIEVRVAIQEGGTPLLARA